MANPRQRRKARSSSHRPVSHSRRAQRNLKKTPPIRGPKILQDSWDKRKTVRQNYAALGLVHNLNPSGSGGVEPASLGTEKLRDPPSTALPMSSQNPSSASTSSATPSDGVPVETPFIPKGHGRIVRDPSGNVIRVEFSAEDQVEGTAVDVPSADVDMDSLQPEIPSAVKRKWVTNLGGSNFAQTANANVVKSLEQISANVDSTLSNTISAPLSYIGERHASKGETAYLQRLVDKYGIGNLEAMARDRKLNSEQRTEGQLKRALTRAGFLKPS